MNKNKGIFNLDYEETVILKSRLGRYKALIKSIREAVQWIMNLKELGSAHRNVQAGLEKIEQLTKKSIEE